MHIELLVEDSSGKRLLDQLMPKLVGEQAVPHTWRIHPYKGIGRIPRNLQTLGDPANRILLDQLPRLLRGYGRTPGIDAVVVVLDVDNRKCLDFLEELQSMVDNCNPSPNTMFRLAIEEIEAWYFGDRDALLAAFPRAKRNILDGYMQDSICGTWEILADAIYPGGALAVKAAGWPLPGQIKHDWAEKVGKFMELERNKSPSFSKLRDGLRRLTAGSA
jgi:hypothetical protein